MGTLRSRRLEERAAFLLRGICQDHPFVDGNKRTAFAAAEVFLQRNGRYIRGTADEVVGFMLAVAQGEHALDGIAQWLRAKGENPLRMAIPHGRFMDYKAHLPGAAALRVAEATREAIRSSPVRSATESTMERHHDALERLARL